VGTEKIPFELANEIDMGSAAKQKCCLTNAEA
jgi:hypothetical protein